MMDGSLPTPIHSRIRARQLWVGSTIVFGLLGCKLLAIQAFGRAPRAPLTFVKEVLAPPRGALLTSDGAVLATSIEQHRAILNARQLISPTATADLVAAELGMPRRPLLAKLQPDLRGRRRGYVVVNDNLSESQRERLQMRAREFAPGRAVATPNPWHGLSFETHTRRQYPQGALAAQLLGTVAVRQLEELCGEVELSYDLLARNTRIEVGAAGLEHALNRLLVGQPGFIKAETDARGQLIPDGVEAPRAAVAGYDVVLTIDQQIQREVERVLDRCRAESKARYVTAIVMKSRTGEILAMATAPGYHPSKYPTSEPNRAVNWATAALYEPGSTFKLLVAAAAIDRLPNWQRIKAHCDGSRELNGRTVKCWILAKQGHGHGQCDLQTGIRESCNMTMAEFGRRLGRKHFLDYLEKFQITALGDDAERLIPGIRRGQVPPLSEISDHTLAGMSFGQHVATTPYALLRAVNVLANEGTLVHPQLVQEVRNHEGATVKSYLARVEPGVVKPATARAVRDMMVEVVNHGTGKNAQIKGVKVAGKTGTAEVAIGKGGYVQGKYIVSFVGFAPADHPEVSVIVVANQPTNPPNPSGGLVAAPVFREIVEATLSRLQRLPRALARSS